MDVGTLHLNLDLVSFAELVRTIKGSPGLIHNREVQFLKSFVEEFKIPPAKAGDGAFDDVKTRGEAPKSAHLSPNVVHDDDENDPGLVAGDNVSPQEMGTPSVEVDRLSMAGTVDLFSIPTTIPPEIGLSIIAEGFAELVPTAISDFCGDMLNPNEPIPLSLCLINILVTTFSEGVSMVIAKVPELSFVQDESKVSAYDLADDLFLDKHAPLLGVKKKSQMALITRIASDALRKAILTIIPSSQARALREEFRLRKDAGEGSGSMDFGELLAIFESVMDNPSYDNCIKSSACVEFTTFTCKDKSVTATELVERYIAALRRSTAVAGNHYSNQHLVKHFLAVVHQYGGDDVFSIACEIAYPTVDRIPTREPIPFFKLAYRFMHHPKLMQDPLGVPANNATGRTTSL